MDDVRDQINQRPDALFAGAEAARTAELYRALRDPVCWVEQLAVVLIMGMKCVALALVFASAWLLAGADEQQSLILGVVVVAGVLPLNPRRFFWRLVFVDRADLAFEAYLQVAKTIEPQ